LRYLSLRWTMISELPGSIRKLKYLQNTWFERESCIFFACWDHTIDMSLPAP
jgi:hypothetical protein